MSFLSLKNMPQGRVKYKKILQASKKFNWNQQNTKNMIYKVSPQLKLKNRQMKQEREFIIGMSRVRRPSKQFSIHYRKFSTTGFTACVIDRVNCHVVGRFKFSSLNYRWMDCTHSLNCYMFISQLDFWCFSSSSGTPSTVE